MEVDEIGGRRNGRCTKWEEDEMGVDEMLVDEMHSRCNGK